MAVAGERRGGALTAQLGGSVKPSPVTFLASAACIYIPLSPSLVLSGNQSITSPFKNYHV